MSSFYIRTDRYSKTTLIRNYDSQSTLPYYFENIESEKASRIYTDKYDGIDLGDNAFYPIIVASTNRSVSIKDGFSFVFKLNNNMSFGNNNGLNGMVSFCWNFKGLNFTDDRGIPVNLRYSSYCPEHKIQGPDEYNSGGLGPQLWKIKDNTVSDYFDDAGFVLTLFPDKNLIGDSKVVHRYRLTLKKYNLHRDNETAVHAAETNGKVFIYEDNLPSDVNLSDKTLLSFYRDEKGFYHLNLNGVEIIEFYSSEYIEYDEESEEYDGHLNLGNMDNCFFTAAVLGSPYQDPDFTIYSINNIPGQYYEEYYGDILEMISNFKSLSLLTVEDSADDIRALLVKYNSAADTTKELLENEKGILRQLLLWYQTNVGPLDIVI